MGFSEKLEELRQAGAEIDRPVERYNGWLFGTRARVLRDSDEDGLSRDELGILVPEEVGNPRYNNVRNRFFILIDGQKCSRSVSPDNIEIIIE